MKYEIMLVVRGDLNADEAQTVAKEMQSLLNVSNIDVTEHGLKDLAYEIAKTRKGYYTQYNFETDSVEGINEFRRLALINKKVLRHLIINLEKDYGYRASINPKKIERNVEFAAIFEKKQEEARKRREERQAAWEERKAQYEANKATGNK